MSSTLRPLTDDELVETTGGWRPMPLPGLPPMPMPMPMPYPLPFPGPCPGPRSLPELPWPAF